VAILGPNGAGKSTLMKCLAGVFKCNGVEIFGKPINEYSREELAKIIGYVPQTIVPGFMRVFDTVLLGRRPYMGLRPSKKDIKMLKIEHLAMKSLNRLSGGELQKLTSSPIKDRTSYVRFKMSLADSASRKSFSKPRTGLIVVQKLRCLKLGQTQAQRVHC